MNVSYKGYYINKHYRRVFFNSPCWNEYGKFNSSCAFMTVFNNEFKGPCRLEEPDRDIY